MTEKRPHKQLLLDNEGNRNRFNIVGKFGILALLKKEIWRSVIEINGGLEPGPEEK